MTPDPALWARLLAWLRDDETRTLETWIKDGTYTIACELELASARTFNAALRRFLKGVGA